MVLTIGHIPFLQPACVELDKTHGELFFHAADAGDQNVTVLWILQIVGIVQADAY